MKGPDCKYVQQRSLETELFMVTLLFVIKPKRSSQKLKHVR